MKTIKTLVNTLLFMSIALLISSCVQTHDFQEPIAEYIITYVDENNQTIELTEPLTVKANTELSFVFTGSGEFVTYWIGDTKHDYAQYQDVTNKAITDGLEEFAKKGNYGLRGDDDGNMIYTYTEPGEYNIVMFVTSNKYFGEEFPSSSFEQKITITE